MAALRASIRVGGRRECKTYVCSMWLMRAEQAVMRVLCPAMGGRRVFAGLAMEAIREVRVDIELREAFPARIWHDARVITAEPAHAPAGNWRRARMAEY